MEVVANKHSKKYPIELNYQDIDKTVSLVFSLDNAKKLQSDLDAAIKEIEETAPPGMYNKEESETGGEVPIPKTVDEAISTLEKILSKEDREYLLKNGAISMHDSLGRWIRNEWGLWTGSELKDELMNMNKGLNHPDDMSNYIIEEFIKYWNNKI